MPKKKHKIIPDPSKPKLERRLGLFQVTIAGVGIILGAGIYTLIGVASATSGNAVWLAFLISAIIALFTGLSYAELSTLFKGNAGEYDYCKNTLGKKFAFFIGLSMIAAGIISAATVALGFAGYFTHLIDLPLLLGAMVLIIIMTFINFIGIKETAMFNALSTMIEFAGLIFIIVLGMKFFGKVDYFEMPLGVHGIFSSTALVFFAYMGFESIVKLREETKNPEKVIPKALILSVIITSIVYVLVAIAAVSVIGWQKLASSNAPLALVAATALGSYAAPMIGIIALFSTANTVLMTMVATSRQMYGMAKEGSLPAFLSHVHHKHRTPYTAVWIIAGLTILFSLIGNISIVALMTDFFLFLTFAAVNLSLILLRYKNIPRYKYFRVPLNIGKLNIPALIGLLSSTGMMFFSLYELIRHIMM